MDTYDPSQYPNAQWGNSAVGEPFDIQPSQYGGGYAATDPAYLGRSASLGHRGRSSRRHYPQQVMGQEYGMMPSQGYSQPYGTMNGYGVNPQVYPSQQFDGELPPLEEYYGEPPPRPLSRRSSRSRGRYTSPHYSQNYDYDQYRDYDRDDYYSGHRRRRHRSYDRDDYRSYDDRSYDDRSYSDDYYRSHHDYNSYDYYGQPYSTVYPSQTHQTVIHPSRSHPTVVPLNGGRGGYVVVPAVGQRVQVVDNRSFLSRLFSPSTWSFGDNQYSVRRRKGYQYYY